MVGREERMNMKAREKNQGRETMGEGGRVLVELLR
jgi:hypothetical protein